MRTRHHLVLSLLCCLTLFGFTGRSDVFFLLFLLTGTVTGVILPDIHMTKPRTLRPKTMAWYLVQAGRNTCLPVLCRGSEVLSGRRADPSDKRCTHSFFGVFVYFAVIAIVMSGIAWLSGDPDLRPVVEVFLAGLSLGMVLHLVQDLCTKKGISPFFPFNETVIRGSIRPCDTLDPRIFHFQVQQAVILGFVWAMQFFSNPFIPPLLWGVPGTCTGIISMVRQSEVRVITPGPRVCEFPEVMPA